MLTADQILAIPLTQPERLFSGPDAIDEERRRLALAWHPDRNRDPKADDVLAHVNALHLEAERIIKAGSWTTPGKMELRGIDGKLRTFRFKRRVAFELGEVIYGPTILAYLVRQDYADLFHNAEKMLSNLKYRDRKVAEQISLRVPKVLSRFETPDGTSVIVMQKTPDVFALEDVLPVLGGKMDPRHVAWVVSDSLNMACYLEWADLTHNGWSPSSLFISPQHHSILPLGGWWYSRKMGHRLNALPSFADRHAPPDMLTSKKADARLDLNCIRAVARHLLGDETGMTLAADQSIPQSMVTFLRHPTSGSAQRDYLEWATDVLPASFGPRKFLKLEINPSQIYAA